MKKIKLYFSEKYFDTEPHLDATGRKRYFLDETIKPKWVYEGLRNLNLPIELREPEKLTWEDLLLVHTKKYIEAVLEGKPKDLASSSGLRWGKKLFRSQLYVNGGIYSASKTALEEGVSGTLSGGFHHASKKRGAGFCVFNGIAIAIRKLQNEGLIKRALVFDCDAHFGDGTFNIFAGDDSVLIVDIFRHIRRGDPTSPPQSKNCIYTQVHDVEIYLEEVRKLPRYLRDFAPDLVIYNAGMDVHKKDRLGGIPGVTEDVLKERDAFVFRTCKNFGVPVAFALGGAYVKYKDEEGNMLPKEKIEEGRKKVSELYISLIKSGIDVFCKPEPPSKLSQRWNN